jgi:hypothetical protein
MQRRHLEPSSAAASVRSAALSERDALGQAPTLVHSERRMRCRSPALGLLFVALPCSALFACAKGESDAAGVSAASGGTTGSGGTPGSGGASGAGMVPSGGMPGAGGIGGAPTSVFPPSVTKPKLMIVGDSISAGPGCYKKYLLQNLISNGLTNYEFVGAYSDGCGGGVRHSAVSCTTSAHYTQPSFMVPNCFADTSFPGMATLVETYDPDLVLIQLGVNDVWSGTAPIDPILANYTTLVAQARAHNPNIVIMVAQIHKIISDNCTNLASTTSAEQLVMAVPAWATAASTTASPVLVADLWTNSDAHEADDCVHPNDAGAQRMGFNWYNALNSILD